MDFVTRIRSMSVQQIKARLKYLEEKKKILEEEEILRQVLDEANSQPLVEVDTFKEELQEPIELDNILLQIYNYYHSISKSSEDLPLIFRDKNYLQLFNIAREELKKTRILNPGHIRQNPIFSSKTTKFGEFIKNEINIVISENFKIIEQIAELTLFENKEILYAHFKPMYYYYTGFHNEELAIKYNYDEHKALMEEVGNFRSGEAIEIFGNLYKPPNFFAKYEDSGPENIYFIGYEITYTTNIQSSLSIETIEKLKAYDPGDNRKFHELTFASTSIGNKTCIPETLYEIHGDLKLKGQHRGSKKFKTERDTLIKKESQELQKAFKGELSKSLKLFTKAHDTKITLVFYGADVGTDERDGKLYVRWKNNKPPITFNKGEIEIWGPDNLDNYNGLKGQKIVLYDEKNEHVAPAIFKPYSYEVLTKNIKQRKYKFTLKPKILRNIESKYKGVLGFDFETKADKDNKQQAYCITVIGHIKKEKITMNFYGENCIDLFIDYVESIATKLNMSKERPHKVIKNIAMYGFNNSNFDNIVGEFWVKLYRKNKNTKFQFAKNSLKYIKFHNIEIFDISLYYATGNLRKTAKAFGLTLKKGYFPHKFVTTETLNYVGPIPGKEYWENDDYEKFIEENKDLKIFDLKKISIDYCMKDSEIVYQVALKHLNNTRGKINGRYYNIESSCTAANMAKKMFTQVFLKTNIVQSPDDVVECERSAYKGGRTEVFKRKFIKEDKYLQYYDINSSYPYEMTKELPYKYINGSSRTFTPKIFKLEDFKDTDLYYASSRYIGEDKYIIPNLVVKTEHGNESNLNTDYAWHWGIELKEAIRNGFEISVTGVHKYETKDIFKEFAEYFYGKRFEIKVKIAELNEQLKLIEKNSEQEKELKEKIAALEVMSNFNKSLMNSLSGKMGQRIFLSNGVAKDVEDMYNQLQGDNKKLRNFDFITDDVLIFEYENLNTKNNAIGKLVKLISYITAAARSHLSQMFRHLGHENIYYCDTDSVFTTTTPAPEYINNNILGKWKLENDKIIEATFIAKKTYEYKYEKDGNIIATKRAKGVSAKAFTSEDYELMHNGGSVIKSKLHFIRGKAYVEIKPQARTISESLTSRKFEGNTSTPFYNSKEKKEYLK